MSMGNICIANRVGGIPEIIENGVNGFLTEDSSAQGIQDALEKAIKALRENRGIIEKAQETAKSFSIEKTANELQRVYSTLVSEA